MVTTEMDVASKTELTEVTVTVETGAVLETVTVAVVTLQNCALA
jgi:hypothetical protein